MTFFVGIKKNDNID